MTTKHDRFAHNDRSRDGRYRASPLCDACNRPVGTNWDTDDEACDGGDGPGFYLCERVRCTAKRDLPLEQRRALYAASVSAR